MEELSSLLDKMPVITEMDEMNDMKIENKGDLRNLN